MKIVSDTIETPAQLKPEQEIAFWMLCYALRADDSCFATAAIDGFLEVCPISQTMLGINKTDD